MPETTSAPDDVASIDGIVEALYEAVSFEPGGSPDWERLASLFHPEIPPHVDETGSVPVLTVLWDEERVDVSIPPELDG